MKILRRFRDMIRGEPEQQINNSKEHINMRELVDIFVKNFREGKITEKQTELQMLDLCKFDFARIYLAKSIQTEEVNVQLTSECFHQLKEVEFSRNILSSVESL